MEVKLGTQKKKKKLDESERISEIHKVIVSEQFVCDENIKTDSRDDLHTNADLRLQLKDAILTGNQITLTFNDGAGVEDSLKSNQ